MLVLLCWLLVTSHWASYPDISLRRGIAYVLMVAIAVSLAVSFDSPADITRPLLHGLGAVLVVNWISAHTVAPIDAAMGLMVFTRKRTARGRWRSMLWLWGLAPR